MLNRPAPHFFYGWLIVAIASATTFVIAGAFVTYGQFIEPLSRTFGWSVGLIGLASTVRQLTSMASALVVGRLTDRIGPRRVMTAGALLAGLVYLLLYFTADPLLFYLLFTVGIAAGFSLIGGTPAQAAVARWFRGKRGLALAITSMGGSLGGVVMAPGIQALLANGEWHNVFAVIGGGILLVLLPLIALAMRDDPASMGLLPDGATAHAAGRMELLPDGAASDEPARMGPRPDGVTAHGRGEYPPEPRDHLSIEPESALPKAEPQGAAPLDVAVESVTTPNAAAPNAMLQSAELLNVDPQNASPPNAAPQNAMLQNAAPQNAAPLSVNTQNAMLPKASPPSRAEPEWTYRTLLASRGFWALTVGFLFASTLYTLIEVYQFTILTSRGIDGASAAWFISIYSLSAALSKFGWGALADRADLRKLIFVALCANSLALVMLAFATALPLIWFYTLLGGAAGGGQSSLLPALIAQKFGHRSFGTVAGLFLPLSMIVPAIAVPLAGYGFDVLHTYTPMFVVIAALAVVSASALLRLPGRASPPGPLSQ